MRIRGIKPSAVCSVSLSPSSSSSTSSYASSIIAANYSASSQDSSNYFPFPFLAAASDRCHGLDLLVKAIHQVTAGSVIGVPYIQRRVTIRRRRRRRGLEFDVFKFDELSQRKSGRIAKKVRKNNNSDKIQQKKQKIRDSVLRPWGRRSELVMGFVTEGEGVYIKRVKDSKNYELSMSKGHDYSILYGMIFYVYAPIVFSLFKRPRV